MFGKKGCAACSAKEDHIASLKAEIETLRMLTAPPPMPSLSPTREFDAAFSAGDAPPAAYSEAEFRRAEEEAVAAASIFTGESETYSQGGVNG